MVELFLSNINHAGYLRRLTFLKTEIQSIISSLNLITLLNLSLGQRSFLIMVVKI